jgi:dTDP-glucose 4,6-dehydratase
MILDTGGCGFIGSAFILDWLAQRREPILKPDPLTDAGDLDCGIAAA